MRNTTTGSHRSRSKTAAGVALGAAALAGAMAVSTSSGSVSGGGWEGTAVLRDANDNNVGKVKFEGDELGTVVKVTLNGITVGLDTYHGLHLHDGDSTRECNRTTTPAFTNVGGHWNPAPTQVHGNHAGDLPSIQVLASGSGSARSLTGRFSPADIDGRAVILHAGPDNFGNIPTRYVLKETQVAGPDGATNNTGDAGGRIACGIVELD